MSIPGPEQRKADAAAAGAGRSCLGCLAYLILTLLLWAAFAISAWRGFLPGVAASAVLWALTVVSARRFRGFS